MKPVCRRSQTIDNDRSKTGDKDSWNAAERQAQCVQKALKNAGMTVEDIDIVNTHATSTPQGDIQECQAIAAVFRDRKEPPAVNNTKSFIGHTMGAAGAPGPERLTSVASMIRATHR